jgi:hypothetical protein
VLAWIERLAGDTMEGIERLTGDTMVEIRKVPHRVWLPGALMVLDMISLHQVSCDTSTYSRKHRQTPASLCKF